MRDGEVAWYHYTYETIIDSENNKMRIVGKMLDITTRKIEETALLEKSEVDTLTGVYNRAATENYIRNHLLTVSEREKCALLVIDIDNFKAVNDNLGHICGDKCLRDIGETLGSVFRSGDIVGRIGGDEFFVFLNDCKNADFIEQKATEVCTALVKEYGNDDVQVQVSASVGVAFFPEHGTDFHTLYEKADKALYVAKGSGKNRFAIFGEN